LEGDRLDSAKASEGIREGREYPAVGRGERSEREMKRILFVSVLAAFFSGVFLAGEKPECKDPEDQVGYSVGYQIGKDSKRQGIDLNPDLVGKGIQDALGGKEPLMTPQDMRETLVDLRKRVVAYEQKRRKR
jgi:FKBP-type peptidyl-prolyl cis-trans isomerase FklB